MKRYIAAIVLLIWPLFCHGDGWFYGSAAGGGGPEISNDFANTDEDDHYIITETDAASATVASSSGKLHWTGTGYSSGLGYHSTALSSPNHYVKAKIMAGTGLNDFTQLSARHSGGDDYYKVRFQGGGEGGIYLYRVVDGSSSYLGDYALGATANTEYTVKLSVSGVGATVTVTVNIDGTDRITYNDTNAARLTSGSYVGFGFRRASDNRDVTIDDFEADAL